MAHRLTTFRGFTDPRASGPRPLRLRHSSRPWSPGVPALKLREEIELLTLIPICDGQYCRSCHSYPKEHVKSDKSAGTVRLIQARTLSVTKKKPEMELQITCGGCLCWRGFDWTSWRLDKKIREEETNDVYWQSLFKYIRIEFKEQHIARFVCKKVKSWRYQNKLASEIFDWERDLPADDVSWAQDEISELFPREKYDCMDNVRVADKSMKRSVRRYRKQQSNGCCGSCDIEVPRGDGRVFMIGCNYGH